MGVRIIGDKKFKPVIEGRDSQDGIGHDESDGVGESLSDALGNEHVIDGAVTADAGDVDSGDNSVVDPSTISDSGPSPYGYTKSGRRRNRPVGSGRRNTSTGNTTRKDPKAFQAFVAECFLAGSEILANMSKIPELEVDEEESKALIEATLNVAAEYDNEFQPDPKTVAWLRLGKVLLQVAGPRVAAVKIRKSREKSERQGRGGIVEMPSPLNAAGV